MHAIRPGVAMLYCNAAAAGGRRMTVRRTHRPAGQRVDAPARPDVPVPVRAAQILRLLIVGHVRADEHTAALQLLEDYAACAPIPSDGAAAADGPPVPASGCSLGVAGGTAAAAPGQGLPLDLMVLRAQALLGCGRLAEAAGQALRGVLPHADCTPGIAKVLREEVDAMQPGLLVVGHNRR